MPEDEYKKDGYGKRPLWQWILIYIVIGGIIYAAIYYFVIAKKGGYGAGTSQNAPQNTTNTSQQNPY